MCPPSMSDRSDSSSLVLKSLLLSLSDDPEDLKLNVALTSGPEDLELKLSLLESSLVLISLTSSINYFTDLFNFLLRSKSSQSGLGLRRRLKEDLGFLNANSDAAPLEGTVELLAPCRTSRPSPPVSGN
jgi:hypothetical protein